jgi:hypothetical protein
MRGHPVLLAKVRGSQRPCSGKDAAICGDGRSRQEDDGSPAIEVDDRAGLVIAEVVPVKPRVGLGGGSVRRMTRPREGGAEL